MSKAPNMRDEGNIVGPDCVCPNTRRRSNRSSHFLREEWYEHLARGAEIVTAYKTSQIVKSWKGVQ